MQLQTVKITALLFHLFVIFTCYVTNSADYFIADWKSTPVSSRPSKAIENILALWSTLAKVEKMSRHEFGRRQLKEIIEVEKDGKRLLQEYKKVLHQRALILNVIKRSGSAAALPTIYDARPDPLQKYFHVQSIICEGINERREEVLSRIHDAIRNIQRRGFPLQTEYRKANHQAGQLKADVKLLSFTGINIKVSHVEKWQNRKTGYSVSSVQPLKTLLRYFQEIDRIDDEVREKLKTQRVEHYDWRYKRNKLVVVAMETKQKIMREEIFPFIEDHAEFFQEFAGHLLSRSTTIANKLQWLDQIPLSKLGKSLIATHAGILSMERQALYIKKEIDKHRPKKKEPDYYDD